MFLIVFESAYISGFMDAVAAYPQVPYVPFDSADDYSQGVRDGYRVMKSRDPLRN